MSRKIFSKVENTTSYFRQMQDAKEASGNARDCAEKLSRAEELLEGDENKSRVSNPEADSLKNKVWAQT